MGVPSLVWIGLQSALLVAALCGLRHQRRQWQRVKGRRRNLAHQIDEHRDALQGVQARIATLAQRVVDLTRQVAHETHLRLAAEVRLRRLESTLSFDPVARSREARRGVFEGVAGQGTASAP